MQDHCDLFCALSGNAGASPDLASCSLLRKKMTFTPKRQIALNRLRWGFTFHRYSLIRRDPRWYLPQRHSLSSTVHFILPLLLSLCNSSALPPWPPPSSNHDHPLSPTYRWWAHLYGCLNHLTTCMRSCGGGGTAGREKKMTGTKHSVDGGDVIKEPGWARQAAMTTTSILQQWWLISVFYQENGQTLYSLGLNVEVRSAVRKCWAFPGDYEKHLFPNRP